MENAGKCWEIPGAIVYKVFRLFIRCRRTLSISVNVLYVLRCIYKATLTFFFYKNNKLRTFRSSNLV